MGIENIVFFVETPILSRYYERYGIGVLREAGFQATIYDLSPILLPTAYENIKSDLCDYERCGFYRFFSYCELKTRIDALNPMDTLVICSMGYKWEYRRAFKMLKRAGIHFCYFMQELSPTDNVKVRKKLAQKLSFWNICHAITRRIPKSFHGVPYADFIIGCGENEEAIEEFKNARLCRLDCPIHYFHSANYEECLQTSSMERLIDEKYCVFVDQYLPYHPDGIELGVQINPNIYYNELDRLFGFIEKKFGIKVVVAAHPRSDYENMHPECFADYAVIKNQTCRLVKDAEFVIYHFSNSMSYMALYKKPVLLVTDTQIEQFYSGAINNICRVFGFTKLDISDGAERKYSKKDIMDRLKVNETCYENYVREYMKKGYEGKLDGETLWEGISKFLKEVEL